MGGLEELPDPLYNRLLYSTVVNAMTRVLYSTEPVPAGCPSALIVRVNSIDKLVRGGTR
jgi:hypothetical protein